MMMMIIMIMIIMMMMRIMIRSSVGDIHNSTLSSSAVSATINIVNWSRWLLGYPVYYFKYGNFKHGKDCHPRCYPGWDDLIRVEILSSKTMLSCPR